MGLSKTVSIVLNGRAFHPSCFSNCVQIVRLILISGLNLRPSMWVLVAELFGPGTRIGPAH